MLKKIIVIILGLFLLSGCSDSFRGYFKKSANNKLVDRKGFEGNKRPPLYNKKYIAAAKRNVVEENFDDEEEDLLSEYDTEKINPILRNRKMYLKMVKQDADRIRAKQQLSAVGSGTSLLDASKAVKKRNNDTSNVQLKKEVEQLKSLLQETHKKLESYKCPESINHDNIASSEIKSSEIILPNNILPPVVGEEGENQDNKIRRVEVGNSKESEIKKKFLSEDFDESIKHKPTAPHRVTNTVIEEYEKAESPPREI